MTPGKNLWHCFSCQIGGGPIDWMMKTKGVSFRHAVELLREGAALTAPRARGSRLLPAAVEFDAGDQALMDQAIRYYQERLKQTPEALAYLARRGLDDAELIERHRLGFADRTLGLRLPEKTRKAGHEIRSRLQKLGLLRESGHEHFNGSIVIPVVSSSGEITEVYERTRLGKRSGHSATPSRVICWADEGFGCAANAARRRVVLAFHTRKSPAI